MKMFNQIKILFVIVFLSAAAGIAEMLLQSQNDTIKLLLALPEFWRDGKISDLVARSGYVVDMNWKNGELIEAVINSKLGGRTKVQYGEKIVEVETRKGKSYRFNEALAQLK